MPLGPLAGCSTIDSAAEPLGLHSRPARHVSACLGPAGSVDCVRGVPARKGRRRTLRRTDVPCLAMSECERVGSLWPEDRIGPVCCPSARLLEVRLGQRGQRRGARGFEWSWSSRDWVVCMDVRKLRQCKWKRFQDGFAGMGIELKCHEAQGGIGWGLTSMNQSR